MKLLKNFILIYFVLFAIAVHIAGMMAANNVIQARDVSSTRLMDIAIRYLDQHYPSTHFLLPAPPSYDSPRLALTPKPADNQFELIFNAPDTIKVCEQGCDYQSVAKAIKKAKPNSAIIIDKAIITSCLLILKPLTIIGKISDENKKPLIDNIACQVKGPIIINAPNVTISNLEISNIRVKDRNGSCIRIEQKAWDTTIDNIHCHDSQNGLLSNIDGGTLLIQNSLFEYNGLKRDENANTKGQAHGMYLSSKGKIHIKNTKILSTKEGGQTLKISAPEMLVENSVLAPLNGNSSRVIDNYGGGNLTIRNSVLQHGPNVQTRTMIGVVTEPSRELKKPHKVTLENNWLIFEEAKDSNFILNLLIQNRLFHTRSIIETISLKDNWIVGMQNVGIEGIDLRNNHIYEKRSNIPLPEFDGSIKTIPLEK